MFKNFRIFILYIPSSQLSLDYVPKVIGLSSMTWLPLLFVFLCRCDAVSMMSPKLTYLGIQPNICFAFSEEATRVAGSPTRRWTMEYLISLLTTFLADSITPTPGAVVWLSERWSASNTCEYC